MRLYRFRYSAYARKVQMLLDLLGGSYELVEVPYSDRNALAELTGGYISVPVLVTNSGQVIVESRVICEHLLLGAAGLRFGPLPLKGPIWAYADFADGPLEDILFRIASPAVRDAWPTAGDRALYVLIKERNSVSDASMRGLPGVPTWLIEQSGSSRPRSKPWRSARSCSGIDRPSRTPHCTAIA